MKHRLVGLPLFFALFACSPSEAQVLPYEVKEGAALANGKCKPTAWVFAIPTTPDPSCDADGDGSKDWGIQVVKAERKTDPVNHVLAYIVYCLDKGGGKFAGLVGRTTGDSTLRARSTVQVL